VKREIWEVVAPTVSEAKRRAAELAGEGSDILYSVLDEGTGGQGFTSVRRPARVRAERRDEGFGRVARQWPDAIPATPPPPAQGPVVRRTLGVGRGSSRPMPKPELVLTETPPPPKVTELGIEPSHARPRESYTPTEEHNRAVREIVEKLFAAMETPCEVRYEHAEYQRIYITVGEEEAGTMIGRRGAGVDAIEHLLGRMVSQRCGSHIPVQIDVNEYRRREQERLEEDAREAAEEARRTGDEIHFEPMSPRERRVVHLAVQGIPGIKTFTVGEGRRRHVVLVYEEESPENNS